MSKLNKLSIEEIKEIVANSYSSAEACKKIGLANKSGSTTRFKKFLINKNIDHSHWTGQSWSKGKTSLDDDRLRKSKDNSLIFTENSNASSYYVRSLLLKHNLKEYKCEECGIVDNWNNKPISLQMDHINGNRKDHRIENLRWLCPNCHSQTDTFCSRNGTKQKASDEELEKALLTSPNIRQALAKFDLENGGNYRRAKRILKKVLDNMQENS